MHKKFRTAFLAFAIGVFLSFAVVAMAAIAYSTVKNFGPYAGYYYTNYAKVVTGGGATGYAEIDTTSDTAPTGYMGVCSYLYLSTGEMVEYSDWWYNDSAVHGIGLYTPNYYTSGYYYANGLTKVYNGNGYDSVYTNSTPYAYN